MILRFNCYIIGLCMQYTTLQYQKYNFKDVSIQLLVKHLRIGLKLLETKNECFMLMCS